MSQVPTTGGKHHVQYLGGLTDKTVIRHLRKVGDNLLNYDKERAYD